MNPSPTTPGPIAALDTLLRLTHQMQDMQFQYTFIDKPRGGDFHFQWDRPRPSKLIRFSCRQPEHPLSYGTIQAGQTGRLMVYATSLKPKTSMVPMPGRSSARAPILCRTMLLE